MSIQYGTALTLRTGIPLQIIRKRSSGRPDEIVFSAETGYGKSDMFLSGLPKGSKVMIVDDVISTGGTLEAMVKVLKDNGIDVREAAIVLNKSKDIKAISKRAGIPIRSIIDVGVEDGRPVIYNRLSVLHRQFLINVQAKRIRFRAQQMDTLQD